MTRLLRGPVSRRFVPAIALALLLAACAGQPERPAGPSTGPTTSPGIVPVPAPAPRDGTQVGMASWYGAQFQGRPTASGEPFDMNAMTAAHRSLPFGTRVRVTNLANGRSVVLRINDRGPYAKKRIIDVSRHAAEQLGFRRAGLAKVRVEVI